MTGKRGQLLLLCRSSSKSLSGLAASSSLLFQFDDLGFSQKLLDMLESTYQMIQIYSVHLISAEYNRLEQLQDKRENMFEELLEKLDETIKQAKISAKSTDIQFRNTMQECGIIVQQRYFHDPTHTLGKAHSFGRTQRFKPLQKQQPKTTDSFYETTEMLKQKEAKGITFTKKERFEKEEADDKTVLNPMYQLVKPNNKQGPIYKKIECDELGKSRASVFTAASQSEVGPGKYFINQNQQKRPQKNCAFSKQKRFIQKKPNYEDIPLHINQNQTKKRPPTAAVLKPKIKKNKKLISKLKQEELRQRLKLVYWKTIPLQLDRLLKKNINGPVIKEKYFDLKKLDGVQRRCAILMLLDRMNLQRGGLDLNVGGDIAKETGCQVVYRKSTPKPFKFSEMDPGPDYYYPRDDLTKPQAAGFTFGKQEQKKPQIDNRDYDIKEEILKHGGNIVINPEHKTHKLSEEQIRDLNRGPGYYDCLFKHVEKRDDIGVVKFADLTEKNARQNNVVDIKEVNDALYIVKYDAIDANKPAPLYKQPANVKPIHLPEKQLFPEHWLFYDGDLKKVRAQIAKNVLIGQGMTFQEYKTYKQKFSAFKRYLDDRRKMPEGLQYNVKYNQLDAHIEGFQMSKQPQKTLINPITKDEFDVDGDNLLLEPEKPKPKLADINFKNMVGRQQAQNDPDFVGDGDRLILNPKKPEKHVPEIDFQKQVNRPQIIIDKNEDESPADGDVLVIDPKLPQKKLPNINFQKQEARPIIKNQVLDDDPSQNILNPVKPKKKIKGYIEMSRMNTTRLVPLLRKNKEQMKKKAQEEDAE